MAMCEEVLSLERWVPLVKGFAYEVARQERLAMRRREAFHRAVQDDGAGWTGSDQAMFGSRETLMREGPIAPHAYAVIADGYSTSEGDR